MNHFDSSILLRLNQFVGRYPIVDSAVVHLSASALLKGQAFMLTLQIMTMFEGPRALATPNLTAKVLTEPKP